MNHCRESNSRKEGWSTITSLEWSPQVLVTGRLPPYTGKMHWPLVAPWQRSPRWPPSESVTQQLPTTPAQNLHAHQFVGGGTPLCPLTAYFLLEQKSWLLERRPWGPHCTEKSSRHHRYSCRHSSPRWNPGHVTPCHSNINKDKNSILLSVNEISRKFSRWRGPSPC